MLQCFDINPFSIRSLFCAVHTNRCSSYIYPFVFILEFQSVYLSYHTYTNNSIRIPTKIILKYTAIATISNTLEP